MGRCYLELLDCVLVEEEARSISKINGKCVIRVTCRVTCTMRVISKQWRDASGRRKIERWSNLERLERGGVGKLKSNFIFSKLELVVNTGSKHTSV